MGSHDEDPRCHRVHVLELSLNRDRGDYNQVADRTIIGLITSIQHPCQHIASLYCALPLDMCILAASIIGLRATFVDTFTSSGSALVTCLIG